MINYLHYTQSKYNCFKTKQILSSDSKVIFYMLNNNFFFTQVASAYVPANTDDYFLFLLQ